MKKLRKKTFLNLDKLYWDFTEQMSEILESAQPSDFYFNVCCPSDVTGDDRFSVIFISPKDFFEKNNMMYDLPLPIGKILPEDFEYQMENIYESDRFPEDVTLELFSLGFLQNKDFDQYCKDIQEIMFEDDDSSIIEELEEEINKQVKEHIDLSKLN